MEVTSPRLLASEVVALVDKIRPDVVLLGALPASGLAAHTRYLCKRLRARFPDLRIIVGRWDRREQAAATRRHLEAAGAGYVGASLVETLAHLQTVQGLEPAALPAEVETI